MAWLTGTDDVVTVRKFWPTVGDVDPDELVTSLASAQVQCETFAPALALGAEVPVNYLKAQAFQARALYRSTVVGSGDQGGEFTVTVFPMDWTVKNLLRPRRPGSPAIA